MESDRKDRKSFEGSEMMTLPYRVGSSEEAAD